MTTATTAPDAEEPTLKVVLEESEDFAPRTRKSTADSLTALRPSLEAVEQRPDKVFTIARVKTPQKAASLVSLLNERYDTKWTFGGRSTDDGTAIVQARFSNKPENARPIRTVKRRKPAAATAKASVRK